MERKEFLKKLAYGAVGAGLVTGIYTWQIEPFWLEFIKKKMPIQNLPEHLVGKTLMQISDVHVGNRFDYNYIINSFKEAQKLKPDFVVYTGDYVSYENSKQIKQLEEVFKHSVTGELGTSAVLGNHDYGLDWSDQHVADQIASVLEDSGVQVLSNQQVDFQGLKIIGMDDKWGLNFDPKKALENYQPNEPSVVLCHNPDVCDLDVWNGYQGWILSGHTHGGQCQPPFLKPPMLPVENKMYSAGEIDLNDGRKLYINRALGHLWQVRFNVRPEITVFELENLQV